MEEDVVQQETKSGKTSSTKSESGKIKLDKFDGTTPIEAYLIKFETTAEHNGWNDRDKLRHMTCSLKGAAEQLLYDRGTGNARTWEQLVQALRDQYGSDAQQVLNRTRLQSRIREDGESLNDLALGIRKLMFLT